VSPREDRTIGGVFRILRRLRSGGMGVVYEAQNSETGARCAVKVVTLPTHPGALDPVGQDSLSDFTASAYKEAVRRFEREVRASSAVVSPHIVQVLDAGFDEKQNAPFIVMELLQGEDLQATLKERSRLPIDLAVRIAMQACAGIAKAHDAGVIHRDIKPGNLFLSEGEDGTLTVKILDFGIAKIKLPDDAAPSGDLTRTGSILGSLHYMSPEQIKGAKNIDHRTDIWSLGVVIYQMLAGITPFKNAETAGETMLAICTRPPEDVREHAPEVPDDLAGIVMRALQMDPERRFASAEAMLAELEKVQTDGRALTRDTLPRSSQAEIAPPAQAPAPPAQAAAPPAPIRGEASSHDDEPGALLTPEAWAPEGLPSERPGRGRSGRTALAAGAIVVVLGSIAFFTTREQSGSAAPPVNAAEPSSRGATAAPVKAADVPARPDAPAPAAATTETASPVEATATSAARSESAKLASKKGGASAGSKGAAREKPAAPPTATAAQASAGPALPDFGGRK
jgi:serine/threonine-protein kinase